MERRAFVGLKLRATLGDDQSVARDDLVLLVNLHMKALLQQVL